jgi:hypothetical protein
MNLVESEPPERNAKAGREGGSIPTPAGNRAGKGLVESETQDRREARRKAREGEYEGSVRSLRTQQRAKSQRQIC